MWLLVALTWAAFLPALKGPFFFDDEFFVVDNPLIRSLSGVAALFGADPQTARLQNTGNFYRPLQMTAFAALRALVGPSPAAFHGAALAFHAGAAVLLLLLFRRLGLSPGAAWAGAALFAVHPVQAEAVAYVSGLGDPMALFLMLSGLLLFAKSWRAEGRRGTALRAAALGCSAAALLSKESAVVFPALALAVALYAGRRPGGPSARETWVFAAAAGALSAAYLALKFTEFSFTGSIGLTDEANAYTQSLAIRLTTFVSILPDYAKLLLFPADLFYEKPYKAYATLWTWRGAGGCLAVAAAVWLAAASWRRRRVLFLGLSWFAAALAPFCGAVPLNAMYLEHWLYVPLGGAAFLWGAGWEEGTQGRRGRAVAALMALVLAGLSARTFLRCRDWADPVRFYQNEVLHAPFSARMRNNLAMSLEDAGQTEEAVRQYRFAIALSGVYPEPHHNLAHLLMDRGEVLPALWEYREALRRDPGYAPACASLLQFYEARGMEPQAVVVRGWLAAALSGGAAKREDIERFFKGLPAPDRK